MRKFLISLAAMLFSALLYSQSADEITLILNSKQATYGQVCYLTAVQKEMIEDIATETDAVEAWRENGIKFADHTPDTPITYKNAAYLLSKVWHIKGSMFFLLTKGNHRYAFKQLKNDGVIPSYADPDYVPSGNDLLNMLTLGHMKYVSELEAAE